MYMISKTIENNYFKKSRKLHILKYNPYRYEYTLKVSECICVRIGALQCCSELKVLWGRVHIWVDFMGQQLYTRVNGSAMNNIYIYGKTPTYLYIFCDR